MGDRKRRLSRAIDALALRVEHGALLAATDPAALLESAGDRIAALESRLAEVERERDAARAELDAPETCDHCGDPCVDYRQRDGERWCIGCVSVEADARIAALEARLRAFELVVESAREVRADLEHQCCEQGDDVECVCEPGLDPCPRCRMFALLDRALAALDETEVRDA